MTWIGEQDLFVAVAFVAAVFVFAGMVQAVTGFGLAIASVPLMSLALDTGSVVVGAVGVGVLITGLAGWRERHHVDVATARRLSVAGLIGMPFGFIAISVLSERQLTYAICAVVIVLALAIAADLRLPSGPVAQRVAGVISGSLLTSTSMNGPPLVFVLHGAALSAQRFRATLQAVFCGQGLIAFLGFVALGHVDAVAAAVLAGGFLGVWPGWKIGDRIFSAISVVVFRRLVLAGLIATAVVSIVQLTL